MDQVNSSAGDNLLELIVRQKADLRKSDQRVAEVVLDRPGEVVDMTLAMVARAAGVSEPTVIRFCTAIGCEGFRDMRVKLARSLAFARSTSHTAISDDDDLGTIITKIFDYNLSNLNWAQSHLDQERVAAAVDMLAGANRIEFFGFVASGIVARDAQQKFPLFGVPCGAAADAHQMFMTAEMLGPGDVAVAISNTGQTHEIVRTIEAAHRRGARTLGITGHADSPLAEVCDVALIVQTLENTDLFTPTVSRLSHLVVIDILSTAVSLRRGDRHHDRIAAMKAGLTRLRTNTED
ncbi:MAG: MurR/RpiR family transcriptional regulator [Maritimibacter sp.]|nr:MurR/RpiR family transcriptional regulator [Maritimibacter sp.]MCB1356454.1 MurR/RpiR family transcriptional regulator [Maritimibacter sp.]